MKNKIINYFKTETVLCISAILAVISMFFVPPDAAYIDYIDFRTLALLFCLMSVMVGFTEIGVFSALANSLLEKTKNFRAVSFILIMLCFFTSMFITNDVALITFVPFAIEVLKKSQNTEYLIPVIVLQTIAANLGSMLTPMGNPQNLYLYSLSGMSLWDFMVIVFPYTAISFVLLTVFNFTVKSKKVEYNTKEITLPIKQTIFYILLFLICVMSVINILNYKLCFVIITLILLIFNRKALAKVDYSLLMTFVFFFVFIGNMGNIDWFKNMLLTLIEGKEVIVSVISSQVMSNVPAAVLLSGFTTNYNSLIIGVNIGGLGTLIASMASLISYKFYATHSPESKGKYIGVFSLWNIIFLVVLLAIYFIK